MESTLLREGGDHAELMWHLTAAARHLLHADGRYSQSEHPIDHDIMDTGWLPLCLRMGHFEPIATSCHRRIIANPLASLDVVEVRCSEQLTVAGNHCGQTALMMMFKFAEELASTKWGRPLWLSS